MTATGERTPKVSAAVLRKAHQSLVARLSDAQVAIDRERLDAYARDESGSGEFPPDLVVFAQRTQDVCEVFRISRELSVPVTPCAARSGKSGGSLPLDGGIALSLERMNQIKEISVEDLTAVAEPGVVTGDLMKAVEAKGLFYPPDPNSLDFCTLGGNVAENAGGPRALKYGVTRDYVIGLEWVLPDGTAVRVGRKTIKGVAGYDLVGLFVGSEGTLGVATEITVQLLPLPKQVKTALILFPSVHDAAIAVSSALAGGILPRALELMDEVCIRAVSASGLSFPPNVGAAILAEVDGNVDEALLEELAGLDRICRQAGAVEMWVASQEAEREKLWAARRVLSNSLKALRRFKISDDIAVPRSHIPEAIDRFKKLGEQMGLTVATYGHAGDGNLHVNLLFDSPSERPIVDQALASILRSTVAMGGTITGEHGVGFSKRQFLPLEQSPALIGLQRELKRFFDPSGLLNPGKIFPLLGDSTS